MSSYYNHATVYGAPFQLKQQRFVLCPYYGCTVFVDKHAKCHNVSSDVFLRAVTNTTVLLVQLLLKN